MFSDPADLSIRYGTYNYHEGYSITVKKCHLHPNFEMINMYDDIAVIEMNKTIFDVINNNNNNNTSNIEFVSLGQQDPMEGEVVIVSGWGDVGADDETSDQLLWTKLIVSNRSKCILKWQNSYEVTDKVLCAKATNNSGSFCHGDSGW